MQRCEDIRNVTTGHLNPRDKLQPGHFRTELILQPESVSREIWAWGNLLVAGSVLRGHQKSW